MDAAFSPDAVCVAEPKNGLNPSEQIGGIRLIDLSTGEQRWHLDLHAPHLAYNSEDHRFYCVSRLLVEPHTWSLIRLGSKILKPDKVRDLVGSWEHAFTPSGRALVTSTGDVYETSTGVLLSHLDFPQRDYPDR
jgi:hypothetical protein